jgi:DNA (cytosine-5)-methyltransferase 1
VRYASVCDGIGAAHVAWQPLGWECAWTSEIEPFPSAVVDERWKLKNVGDMTKLTEEQLHHEGPISLFVGGTPCQSFSVAGLRKGLEDPRGNLALRFTQLVGVLRPTWVVWENVPGVLSSAGGRDFGTFLGALAELGYGFAYRILDAQWFGVAQRRRRVFVVAHARDWRRAAAVLFERESVFGNPPTRGKAGQEVTGPIAGCSNGGGANGPGRTADDADSLIASSVTAKWSKGSGGPAGDECQNLVAFHPTQDPISSDDGLTHSLGCGSSRGCATAAIAFTQNSRDEVRQINGDGQIAGALSADAGMHQTNYVAQGFTYSGYSNQPAWMTGDRTDCLPASGHSDGSHQGVGVAVAFNSDQRTEGHATWPLGASDGRKVEVGVRHNMAVRRLTPRECERLQGFPDDYTLVTYRNKPAADGPRYKALGNSMAVPVMRWIGERIASVDSLDGAT